MTLDPRRLADLAIPVGTGWLLGACKESKEEYYRVLKLCSQSWLEGKNEIVPWWNYFLGTLRSAYKEFQRQVESVEARPAKSDLVRQTVLAHVERFTLADMAAQLPAASPQLIKRCWRR